MKDRRFRLRTRAALPLCIAVTTSVVAPMPLVAQTFRGAINGSVTDTTNSAVPNATVTITNVATGIVRQSTSSSSGEFLFSDLALGTYSIATSAPGFNTVQTNNVMVSAGSTFSLTISLPPATTQTVVQVSASAVSLDTTSVTQTTDIGSKAVNSVPMNGRDFTQLISVAPGFGGYSAGGFGSVNGSRANQVNWQIDGVDNNDLWSNVPAVNQGGIEAIPGVVLPLDSIEQYSEQTQSTAESGRNPGGVVNVVTKSGTNTVHGSIYYFNRNELVAANSPFANGAPKGQLRFPQYGASFGGPILKNRLFYFFNYEKQAFTITSSASDTMPTTAFQADAKNLLNQFGLVPTSVATASLATFWPSNILNCPTGQAGCDAADNYYSNSPIVGHSFNGVGKIDFAINAKHSLALRMFGGQGNQIAPVGSLNPYYFQEGPLHVFNWSAVLNSMLTSRFTNQLLFGVNYFNQPYLDANHSMNPISIGFNTGAAQPVLSGAPGINIVGFDNIQNSTPPLGRNDITGQITDTASFVTGKHELRFSGEFRRGFINEFYHRRSRGNFSFPGTQGPWGYNADASSSSFGFQSAPCQATYGYGTPTAAQQAYVNNLSAQANGSQVLALADFLIGCTQQAQIVRGNPERDVFADSFSGSVSDAYQVTERLNLNLGVRYDYLGPMHNNQKNLSVFRPDNSKAVNGLVFQGAGIDSLWPRTPYNFSPRVGFAYRLPHAGAVVRGGIGMFFDQPNLNPFLDNEAPNGGAAGAESNPAGPSPVSSLSSTNVVITPGTLLFPTTAAYSPDNFYNLFTVSPNLRSAYTFNFNLNVEKSLGRNSVFTLGYVGSQSRKQLVNHDINQAALGTTNLGTAAQNLTRPYGTQFANYGVINEVASIGNANYNSLQTTLRTSDWHHLTTQFSYTWAHALDIDSQNRSTNLTDSFDPHFDYGNMDYDTRHAFTAYAMYELPGSRHLRLVSNGWQLNTLVSFHSGQPYTIYTGSDTSGTGEGEDRADVVPGVSRYAGTSKSIVNGQVQWLSPNAFALPTDYSFGNMRRNQLQAPGYGDVDLSVFKNTRFQLGGHAFDTQLRVEMFNLFNRVNLAPPDHSVGDGAAFGTITSTIGYFNGAPVVGPGEPFNTQFGLKVLF